MNSKQDLSTNPWAKFLGINSLENIENAEVSSKPKTDVTMLNYEDMALYGLCPVWEDLHLMACRICSIILKPQALKKHMEIRHRLGDVQNKKDEVPLPSPSFNYHRQLLIPSVACSNIPATTSTNVSVVETYCASTSADSCPPSSSAPKLSQWSYFKDETRGASLQTPLYLNTSSIVRVKPHNTKLKMSTSPYTKSDSSLSRNAQGTARKSMMSHCKKELSPLPDLLSNFTSASSIASLSTSSKSNNTSSLSEGSRPDEVVPVYTSILQSGQPTSSSGSTSDNSEASSETGKKTPTLEKLVLRRGMKGVAKNKDSSHETYFMVVKAKDRQQNLLAARQQIRKQTNVVHQEKDKVDKRMKKLETVRDHLISQLFQELQAVKHKLHQCTVAKAELEKDALATKAQIEELNRRAKGAEAKAAILVQQLDVANRRIEVSDCEKESFKAESLEWQKKYQCLAEKFDIFTSGSSNFMEQTQKPNQIYNVFQGDIQHSEFCEERKCGWQYRAEAAESELRRHQDCSIEKNNYEFLNTQITGFQMQQEVYPTIMPPPSVIPTPVPFAEKLIAEIRNIEFREIRTYQRQMTNERGEMFQQTTRSIIVEEEVP